VHRFWPEDGGELRGTKLTGSVNLPSAKKNIGSFAWPG
jgi:hypothetical protein